MPNLHKANLLQQLQERFGELRKMPESQSLFIIGEDAARIYYRYSKLHDERRTFFGLREVDLRRLEGHNSFLCLQLDDGSDPIFIPYSDFEEVFHATEPANDGQYKVQLYLTEQTKELYIARQGRFSVEGFICFDSLQRSLNEGHLNDYQALSHYQVQTLLAGIGHCKGHQVWIPDHDTGRLDWSITDQFQLCKALPNGFEKVAAILAEIDVVWINAGATRIEALFEVEHSTPIYSGLLRFNDLLLTAPSLSRFSIVSNDTRRALFSRQMYRPTFKKSGLSDLVSFLEYPNVFDWHERLVRGEHTDATQNIK
ncbi:MAG: hypothetical protein WC058_11660 [Phycisphaeraceae bacterium]